MYSHFDKSKPVAIGSDHAGFDYMEDLISFHIQKTPLITRILRTRSPVQLKTGMPHSEFYSAAAPMG